jgi:hypothetical protein
MRCTAATIEMINLQVQHLVVVLEGIELQAEAVDSFVRLRWNVNNDAVVGGDQESNLSIEEGKRLFGQGIEPLGLGWTNRKIGLMDFVGQVT